MEGETYKSSSARRVHMGPIPAAVPLHRRSEETGALVNAVESTNSLAVRVKYNPVGTGRVNADTVVTVALGGVEVENEN